MDCFVFGMCEFVVFDDVDDFLEVVLIMVIIWSERGSEMV